MWLHDVLPLAACTFFSSFFTKQASAPTGAALTFLGAGIARCSVDSDDCIFSLMFKHHFGPTLWRA